MDRFSAEKFLGIAIILERNRARYRAPKVVGDEMFAKKQYILTSEEREQLSKEFIALSEHFAAIGLTISAKNAQRLHDILIEGSDSVGNIWLAWEIDKVEELLIHETEDTLFLYVPKHRARYYEKPLDGWAEVIEKFPQVTLDVEEAGRCLACDRYAGSVFHTMLVAEVGAMEIAKLIGVNDPKPGWPATIREMTRVVHREKFENLSPLEQQHRGLLGQLLPLMESMQDGWRNKISHVGNKLVLMSGEFSPQIAEEILIATRGFMRRLAMAI